MEKGVSKMAYRTSYTVAKEKKRDNYSYIDGNTVRKIESPQRRSLKEDNNQLSHRTRKNRDKARHMNLGYVLFLVVALVSSGLVLISYIRVESDITMAMKKIASMESELNDLKLSNDERYNRASSAYDLEEVRQIAIGELGMRYAQEGQIISISGAGSDYVRQLSDFD